MTAASLAIPVPMLTALLCAALAILVARLDLGARRASLLLASAFAIWALQAFLVGVRFGYSVSAFIPLQRVLPLFPGPLIYLGFLALTMESLPFSRVGSWHLAVPLCVTAFVWLSVDGLPLLDWVIGASYLVYIAALILLWRRGPDAVTHARVELAGSLPIWMLRAAGLLIFLLIMDTFIAIDFALHTGGNVSNLIMFGTVPLVLILLLLLTVLPRIQPVPAKRSESLSLEMQAKDKEIEKRLAALMSEDRLFLDPDLTVQRLARRLHVPARDVSAAINRTKGMNASQYVNGFRLTHAAALLVTDTASVKAVAEASGFLTRSNFYREFQRVYGMSPTAYRQSRLGEPCAPEGRDLI